MRRKIVVAALVYTLALLGVVFYLPSVDAPPDLDKIHPVALYTGRRVQVISISKEREECSLIVCRDDSKGLRLLAVPSHRADGRRVKSGDIYAVDYVYFPSQKFGTITRIYGVKSAPHIRPLKLP
jgi:hypothetical protein